MKIRIHRPTVKLRINRQSDFPLLGICLVMLLIYLSPFTASLSSYAAFVLCLIRVVRYDARVFAVDYCLMLPMAQIFCTSGGMSIFVYVSLFAAVWYFIKTGIRRNASYLMLILLMNYLLTRMQMSINNFLLCFGQICVLCIVLPEQDRDSAVRAAKYFCIGVLISSLYALVFRNTWQLRSLLGAEDEAIWGTGIRRFYGFYRDPNYYMTLLVLGLALLSKLKNCRQITGPAFVLMCLGMVLFGILTYSKMFFLTTVLFGVVYIIWRFRDRKYFWGILLIILAVIGARILFSLKIGILETLFARLLSASNVSELTTGRTDVYMRYLSEITQSVFTLLFGLGLSAEGLYKDAHNLYLEVTYYLGITGLVLLAGLSISMIRVMGRKAASLPAQNAIAKYLPLFLLFVLYCSLHGMFQIMFYGGLFVALLAMLVTREEQPVLEGSDCD